MKNDYTTHPILNKESAKKWRNDRGITSIYWILILFSFVLRSNKLEAAYCGTPTSTVTINPSTVPQNTAAYSSGHRAFTFTAVAGCTYTFTTCGNSSIDTYLRLFSGAGVTQVASNDDACGLQSNLVWTAPSAGAYTLLLSRFSCNPLNSATYVTYSSSCSSVPDPTSITASTSVLCAGLASGVTLTANGVVGTVYWFEGGCATSGEIGTGSTITVSPTVTTTYFARNYSGGVWSTDCVNTTITVNPAPIVNAGADVAVCAGSSVTLNGSASASGSATGDLSTTFAGGNGQNGNMFDISVLQNVTITDFDVNSYSGTGNFEVYYKSGSYVGSETNSAAWTLLATATNVVSNGSGVATPLNLGLNLNLTAGQTYSFYITGTNQSVNYTNGTLVGNVYAANTELIIYEGVGKSYPFGSTYSPRIWNGTIHYTTGTSGTPSIAWTPSATLSNATILNPNATPSLTTTYTLTATSNGCTASDEVVVTVEQPSVAPTSISGAGNMCLGSTATLSVQGGSLGTNAMWLWMSGSCTGTVVGTGSSISVTPSVSTDYYVAAMSVGACPSSSCTNAVITLPTPSANLSGNNASASCTVNQNGYIHLLDVNGDLIASINSNGQNLGTVTATSYIEGAPLLVEACGNPGNTTMMTSVMDRHWVISTQNAPTGPVSVLLPFTDNEVASLNLEAINNQNPNDNVMSLSDVGCTKYSGPNEDNLFDNDCTSNGGSGNFSWHPQTANGLVNNYLSAHPGTNRFITIDVNSFSEFWLHGSATNAPLPVELTSFQANCISDTDVEVSWSTATEYNSSHYVIRKSYDGIDWQVVGFIQAAGMSQTAIDYSIIDKADPYNRTVYYSLDQYDLDGVSKELWVTQTNCAEVEMSEMLVYPNPGNGEMNVKIVEPESLGQCTVVLSDMNGSVVLMKDVEINKGTTIVYLDGIELNNGLYLLHYQNDTYRSSSVKYSKISQ